MLQVLYVLLNYQYEGITSSCYRSFMFNLIISMRELPLHVTGPLCLLNYQYEGITSSCYRSFMFNLIISIRELPLHVRGPLCLT